MQKDKNLSNLLTIVLIALLLWMIISPNIQTSTPEKNLIDHKGKISVTATSMKYLHLGKQELVLDIGRGNTIIMLGKLNNQSDYRIDNMKVQVYFYDEKNQLSNTVQKLVYFTFPPKEERDFSIAFYEDEVSIADKFEIEIIDAIQID
ncbi:MAG: FxLYD domain-containing protein [Pseudomonadota bacterium]